MKKTILYLLISSFFFASCEKYDETQKDMSKLTPISLSEFKQKVCGSVWVRSSSDGNFEDEDQYAVPFYEDKLAFVNENGIVFEEDQITTFYYSEPNTYYYTSPIYYNTANGYVCLGNEDKLMKIYYVDNETMKLVRGNRVSNGKHIYSAYTYKKVSQNNLEEWKKISKSHKEANKYFDFDEKGVPVACTAKETVISPDMFVEQIVGNEWKSSTYSTMYEWSDEYYEILNDGTMRTMSYPYGYASGARYDLYFPSESTIIITKRPYKGESTTNTYSFKYECNASIPGINDIVYVDDQNQSQRIRIANYGTSYGDPNIDCIRAIICDEGHYCFAVFDRK